MSASDPNSAIYVTDSAKEIKTKVCFKHCILVENYCNFIFYLRPFKFWSSIKSSVL